MILMGDIVSVWVDGCFWNSIFGMKPSTRQREGREWGEEQLFLLYPDYVSLLPFLAYHMLSHSHKLVVVVVLLVIVILVPPPPHSSNRRIWYSSNGILNHANRPLVSKCTISSHPTPCLPVRPVLVFAPRKFRWHLKNVRQILMLWRINCM